MIDSPVVVIDKHWNPVRGIPVGQGFAPDYLSSSEIQHIKDTVASEFRDTLVKEVTAGGYQVVERPGADTVRVSPALIDVYMDTPDHTMLTFPDPGRMTLVMELCDAPTGHTVARLVDKKTGNMGVLQGPNSVTDNADFRRAVQDWARQLRAGLDKLSGQPL